MDIRQPAFLLPSETFGPNGDIQLQNIVTFLFPSGAQRIFGFLCSLTEILQSSRNFVKCNRYVYLMVKSQCLGSYLANILQNTPQGNNCDLGRDLFHFLNNGKVINDMNNDLLGTS